MAKIKTADLIDRALDYAVELAEGASPDEAFMRVTEPDGEWSCSPSTNPAQGHPILEREGINLKNDGLTGGAWWACNPERRFHQSGPTMLVAGLRCFVASRLGDEVEVPEELLS